MLRSRVKEFTQNSRPKSVQHKRRMIKQTASQNNLHPMTAGIAAPMNQNKFLQIKKKFMRITFFYFEI